MINITQADEFRGSSFIKVNPKITLSCISPEANKLLEDIMQEWEIHLNELKSTWGKDYEPSYYGFAYWLVRWSELIQPKQRKQSNETQ